MIQRIDTGPRLSHAVVHNGTVYVAGQVPDDLSLDIHGQTKQVLDKIDALLAKAGSDRKHMLYATVWLPAIGDFNAFNEVWDAWVPAGEAPARACIESRLARPGIKVEVAVVAAVAA